MNGLELQQICWHVSGKEIIRKVSFSLEKGGILSIIGPSGSGKTSLLRIIAGLVRDYSGSVFWENRPLDRLPPEKRGAVLMRQSGNLLPHLTVRENIAFGMKMRRVPGEEIRKTAAFLLAMTGLEKKADSLPREISAGEAQRTALARALAVKPRLVLLDEPFSNLDPGLRSELRLCTLEAVRTTGASMIMVTHEWEEAFLLGDSAAVLFEGRLFPLDQNGQLSRDEDFFPVRRYMDGCRIVRGFIAGGVFSGEGFSLPCKAPDGPARAFVMGNSITVMLQCYRGSGASFVPQ